MTVFFNHENEGYLILDRATLHNINNIFDLLNSSNREV